MVLFSILIWYSASDVNRVDAERRAAESRTQAQLARLDLLNHITRAIGERQDLRSIFQVVVRSLEDQLRVDFSCVATYDRTSEKLVIQSVGSRSQALALELAMPEHAQMAVEGNGLSRAVQGTLVYEPDITQLPFPFPRRLSQVGLRALVIAPLRAESSVFGVLMAARREPHSFSSPDCEFLRQLSEHVGLATHQTQIYNALQHAYDDLRQSQQAVMQQERLRALGQMSSGIAHDINNALSPAALYTESLMEQETALSDEGRKQLDTIRRAIDDVSYTVSRMREFYGQREPQIQLAAVDLNRCAQQVAELTRARWRDLPQERGVVIDFRLDLAPSIPAVQGIESEIRDALTNLVFNAVDAMPHGGVLTLRTRSDRGQPGNGQPGNGGPASLPDVCLEVTDTGIGMDEETRRRCMEPFFTTKGERGTGLGLAMVYGMAKRHGAELELESSPGTGTTVRIVFPPAPAGEALGADPRVPLRPAQRLRILVVDDDPMILQSLHDALGNDGHLVTLADGGQAGIKAFHAALARGEPHAVVITDLGMPYVDGRAVAAAVRAASPKTPVILLTGWGQRLQSTNDIPANVDRVLSKPPKLRELRAALHELTA
jgi:signal transduction histidine kinase/ActR/RegA family two-component response regulator